VAAPPGTAVQPTDAVFIVRHRDGRGLKEAVALLEDAIVVAATPPAPRPLIVETVREGTPA
jgi:hypothetical protein